MSKNYMMQIEIKLMNDLVLITVKSIVKKQRKPQRENPEKGKQASKKAYSTNPEKGKQASKKAYSEKPEKAKQASKEAYNKNPKKAKESFKRAYKINAENLKEASRNAHKSNPAKAKRPQRWHMQVVLINFKKPLNNDIQVKRRKYAKKKRMLQPPKDSLVKEYVNTFANIFIQNPEIKLYLTMKFNKKFKSYVLKLNTSKKAKLACSKKIDT